MPNRLSPGWTMYNRLAPPTPNVGKLIIGRGFGVILVVVRGMVSNCPTYNRFGFAIAFADRIASGVVLKRCAIAARKSPGLTVYPVYVVTVVIVVPGA